MSAGLGAVALVCVAGAVPGAQVVSVTESPLRPFAGPGEQPVAKGPDPTPFTQFYVTAALTAPGAITDATGNQVQIAQSGQFQFPALRLTFSVSPRLLATQPQDERHHGGTLTRLSANVRVQALDAAGQPLTGPGGRTAVETLALSPSERSTSTGTPSNVSAEARQGFTLLTSHLGHIGAAVAAFEGAFHRAPSPTQVAYQSAADQFGWRWFRATDAPIDGLHYTSALMQVPATAASLRVSIELVSDWERFGAWVKTYDLTVSLK